MSAVGEWNVAPMSQPREHRPRPRQRARYLLPSTPSVVTPARPAMYFRPIFSTASLKWTSTQLSLCARW